MDISYRFRLPRPLPPSCSSVRLSKPSICAAGGSCRRRRRGAPCLFAVAAALLPPAPAGRGIRRGTVHACCSGHSGVQPTAGHTRRRPAAVIRGRTAGPTDAHDRQPGLRRATSADRYANRLGRSHFISGPTEGRCIKCDSEIIDGTARF